MSYRFGETYETFVDFTPATTLTDGTTYFAMRNTGTRTAVINAINLTLLFGGTAAATVSSYGIARFSTATPTGGTAQTPVKKKNAMGTSTMGDIRSLGTGLTTTSVVFEGHAIRVGHANQLAMATAFLEQISNDDESPRLELAPGEGLCIRANGTIVAGSRVLGSITWDEKG